MIHRSTDGKYHKIYYIIEYILWFCANQGLGWSSENTKYNNHIWLEMTVNYFAKKHLCVGAS